jgi:hypothetical protein
MVRIRNPSKSDPDHNALPGETEAGNATKV